MIVKLLTEHHLRFLSLKGGRTDPSESTHVKMPHCWKSHVTAHVIVTPCVVPRPVRGDNPRALASGLSHVQVDKHGLTILYHLHQCRSCTSRDISC